MTAGGRGARRVRTLLSGAVSKGMGMGSSMREVPLQCEYPGGGMSVVTLACVCDLLTSSCLVRLCLLKL